MEYVQGGAEFHGKNTKGGLKAAMAENPEAVILYGTSAMGPQFRGPAANLPDNVTFNVVGPDPYTKRNWYASVKVGRGGKLTVS